jgi:hypothetical protein
MNPYCVERSVIIIIIHKRVVLLLLSALQEDESVRQTQFLLLCRESNYEFINVKSRWNDTIEFPYELITPTVKVHPVTLSVQQ